MPFAPDQHANLAYSTVAIAPSPAISGTSLTVTTGEGSRFPAVPFNATVWAAGEVPTPANAEIVRVTAITGNNTFTITRAQEGTGQRSITAGDQIAATITLKTLNDIEDALSDVISTHNRLSNVVSGLGGGAASATSNELSAVSAQAASAISDLRSAHNALSQAVSAASVLSTGGIPTAGLQNVLNALSNRISLAGAGGVSVTSNELSAVSAQAASAISVVSNAVSIVSQAVSVLSQANSAAHASLELHASTASAAATSADAHANAASAAATSVRLELSQAVSIISQQVSVLSQRVSILFSGVSVLSTGGISTHGMQSILNALSNRISLAGVGGVSVTSTELSLVSAQAASAISQLTSVVSQGFSAISQTLSAHSQNISLISNALSNETSNRVSADNVLSQAISVVSQQVSVLSQQVSVLSQAHSVLSQAHSVLSNIVSGIVSGASVRSVGNISTRGFQSILDALSTRISAGGGGAGSVTSTELSIVSSNAAQAVSVVSQALSVETAARISVDNVISNQVSIALQGVSVLSQQVSVLSQQISVITAALSNLTSSTSSMSTKLSNLVSVVDIISQQISVISNLVSATGNVTPQTRSRVAAQSISSITLIDIGSLSVSCAAGGFYIIDAKLVYEVAVTSGGVAFGFSAPAVGPGGANFVMHLMSLPTQGQIAMPHPALALSAVAAGQTIMGSVVVANLGARQLMQLESYLVTSAAGSFQLMAKVSVATAVMTINSGYIRAYRIA